MPVCPHPHQDPVVNLIFNPARQSEWKECDLPGPWGKLSCGNLIVAHPSFGNAQKCTWCTLALCASVSKFKVTQEDYKRKMEVLGKVMANDLELSGLDAEIAMKEVELQGLQKSAWEKRNVIMRENEKLQEVPEKKAKEVSFEVKGHEVEGQRY